MFSLFMVGIFTFTLQLAVMHESKHESEITKLTGEYDFVNDYTLYSNSTSREISAALQSGIVEEDADSDLLSGGLSASRLTINIGSSILKTVTLTATDLGIPLIFVKAFMGIIFAVLILIAIALIMRTKPEI